MASPSVVGAVAVFSLIVDRAVAVFTGTDYRNSYVQRSDMAEPTESYSGMLRWKTPLQN